MTEKRIRAVTAPAVCGRTVAPPSKSDAHRALISAALSEGETEIVIPSVSDDIRATLGAISALGAEVRDLGYGYAVSGIRAREHAEIDCAESGSTLRFLVPVAAALGVNARFVGGGRLPERPLSALTALLSAHGALPRREGEAELPLALSGRLSPGRYELAGNVSSQYITGLMLALPLLRERSEIALLTRLESAPYVEMTRETLARFGVFWEWRDGSLSLSADSRYRSPLRYEVEGDWSSAAFPLVSGALGGSVSVSGLSEKSLQADRAIVGLLSLAGASVSFENGTVTALRGEIRPFTFDFSACPDLFPIAAVLAAGARGESRLTGAARLRLKESDRIASTAAMLRALGGAVRETEDGLTVFGSGALSGGRADGAGDHRIVMAAAAARAISQGDIEIVGADAVSKSYPDFFDDFAFLKGASHEIILR